MSKLTRIKFTGMSPMHIGIGRDSYDISQSQLHSDTLTAALAAMRAIQGKDTDLDRWLDLVALSLAFPYYGDTYFLPKPAGRLHVTFGKSEADDMLHRKALKKVAWIDSRLWPKLISGEQSVIEPTQLHGEFLLDKTVTDFETPMKQTISQRVSVNRTGADDAEPFAFAWTFFRPNAGLYCLLDAPDEMTDEIRDLFTMLGEQGVGSDRSVGGGHFDVELSEQSLPDVPNSNAVMTLSMLIPSAEELPTLNLEQSQFNIIKRGGFMAGTTDDDKRHLRKNTIHMFAEGAVFATTSAPRGIVVDLRPAVASHPIFRSGRAICVNIKQQHDEQL